MFISVLVVAIVLFLFWAPREKLALFWHPQSVRLPHVAQPSSSDLIDLQKNINAFEMPYTGLVEGAEKSVQFINPDNPQKSKYCVLYVHGFSACRQELTPIPENVAKALNANFYATRLTGHGLDSDSLGAAKPSDWIFDMQEAFEVARTLGEKVIIISTSTGGTLTTWLAEQPECQKLLAALIFVAPNFGPKHRATPMFLWPFARYWLPFLSGPNHSWEPDNEAIARFWTYSYPVSVLFGLNVLVHSVRASDIESIVTPSLFMYSDEDDTVNSKQTDQVFRRWGSKVKHRIAVPAIEGNTNHVIAGNMTRPENNDLFTEEMLHFIKRHAVN